MAQKTSIILITGFPGVGKTTLMQKICVQLRERNVDIHGFFTEEVRNDRGRRIGFDIVTLAGTRAILARENAPDGLPRPKVGKYHVFVDDFERLALPLLGEQGHQLVVLDEIGKMELLSKKFETAVKTLMDKVPILATVPINKGSPIGIVTHLKSFPKSKTFVVTPDNRNSIQSEILQCIQELLK